ncbi:cytochrome b561 and DOMON domain-containing protein At3g25290-like [Corylus avellana]|uniref:cytochrome b561 and DOMON domain-containing protein At3g25290-like n=1 Tax=Corylus avellana TaxID=13451 RepID=UPI00286ABA5D|nr:cytochrome b561 and DOMON domain-containing protein At3g25290-like [Corylus avellana]
MTSHCLYILLSMVFPLQYSISAHASSFNGGISLMQVDDHSNINVEDLVPHIQSSNSEVTVDLRSRKGHSLWHRQRRHLRNGHEILIIIGWGTMLPMGVIVARYFKEFPMTCNEWYQLHIMLQSVGYILGTIGWAIGISLGNTSRQSAYKTQRILSTIVFTLTTIQMLALFWQPKKGDEYRKWWETCHHCLGYALLVLIVANILVGIQNQSQAENLKWAYVVILGLLALIALALEIYRWVKSKVIRQSVELNSSMYTSP